MTEQTLGDLRSVVADFGFTDYLRHLPAAEAAGAEGRPLKVAILRSYTLEQIEPVLRLRLLLEGFVPDVWIGGYNQYHVEILDPSSALYAHEPDLVLLMVRLEEVLPDFATAFADRSLEAWEQEVDRAAQELASLATRVAEQAGAQVLVQTMSAGSQAYFGAYDVQTAGGQADLVARFNRALRTATDTPGVFLWDFEGVERRLGHEALYDPKMWFVSRNPYRQTAYPALVDDLLRYVLSAMGTSKKCVVLDLDNTLWGGVAGEDGLEGVQLGDNYPGNCYKEFQRRLLRLYHRGIILALNSKNNEEDAYRIIDEHPDMVLSREHFAAARINWRDKATNLRELASELNIGTDSFIFIDDNPAECELVRQELPEVDVVELSMKPHLIPDVATSLRLVENVRLTAEDRKKGEMYRAQAERREHEASFETTDLAAFLESLQLEVEIAEADEFSTPRVAQLTQKTNQFNMTTRRYTEADIKGFAGGNDSRVYAVSAKDRFGDHGIIGVMILARESAHCRIDTFLLSCRVIGRGIEDAMVERATDDARAWGAEKLMGEFFPTAKNAPAAGFFEKAGFEAAGDGVFSRPVGSG